MAEHGTRVTQTKVSQFVAIHIGQVRAFGVGHVQREWRGPVVHPVQRHAKHQVL